MNLFPTWLNAHPFIHVIIYAEDNGGQKDKHYWTNDSRGWNGYVILQLKHFEEKKPKWKREHEKIPLAKNV